MMQTHSCDCPATDPAITSPKWQLWSRLTGCKWSEGSSVMYGGLQTLWSTKTSVVTVLLLTAFDAVNVTVYWPDLRPAAAAAAALNIKITNKKTTSYKNHQRKSKFHEYGLVCCVKMQHITVGINKATILTLKQSQPTCLLQKMKPTTKKLHITLKS